jgi:hypothetical protein
VGGQKNVIDFGFRSISWEQVLIKEGLKKKKKGGKNLTSQKYCVLLLPTCVTGVLV